MSVSIKHRLEFGLVDSTNDLARLYPPGTALIAQTQSQGRGRRGQAWLSPVGGGIYLSVHLLLDPSLECLAQRVASACLRLVKSFGGQAFYKWPNDLLDSNYQKFGGILIEALSPGDLIIGIGLNLAAPSANFAAFPVPQAHRDQIIARLLAELELCLSEPSEQVLAFCWAESIHRLRSHFTFLEAESAEPYRALGLNADGSLRAEDPLSGGEISLTVASGLQVLAL